MPSPKRTIEVSSVSFPVNKRLTLKKIFLPLILFFIVCIFLARNLFAAWWLVVVVLIGVLILASINYYYLKVFYYKLEDTYLLIKRHGLNPREIIIEYARIKDIVIFRDTLDRFFGLYEIRFDLDLTSPAAQKMALIEGLDEVEAHEFKVVLEHLIELHKKEDTAVR